MAALTNQLGERAVFKNICSLKIELVGLIFTCGPSCLTTKLRSLPWCKISHFKVRKVLLGFDGSAYSDNLLPNNLSSFTLLLHCI